MQMLPAAVEFDVVTHEGGVIGFSIEQVQLNIICIGTTKGLLGPNRYHKSKYATVLKWLDPVIWMCFVQIFVDA